MDWPDCPCGIAVPSSTCVQPRLSDPASSNDVQQFLGEASTGDVPQFFGDLSVLQGKLVEQRGELPRGRSSQPQVLSSNCLLPLLLLPFEYFSVVPRSLPFFWLKLRLSFVGFVMNPMVSRIAVLRGELVEQRGELPRGTRSQPPLLSPNCV